MQLFKSEFLKLNKSDLVRGVVVAALATLLGMLQQGLTAHGLDVIHYDWSSILSLSTQAGLAYLFKNLISDPQGKVLGKIG